METEKKIQIVRITDEVAGAVKDSGVKEGLILVNPMHITAAVVVNDNESGLHSDYLKVLEKLVGEREIVRSWQAAEAEEGFCSEPGAHVDRHETGC